jgi:hypothetical protein
LVKTKLLIIYVRRFKSGNDGSLLEIKEEEELWLGSGYLSNERETKSRSDFMSHKNVQFSSCFNP